MKLLLSIFFVVIILGCGVKKAEAKDNYKTPSQQQNQAQQAFGGSSFGGSTNFEYHDRLQLPNVPSIMIPPNYSATGCDKSTVGSSGWGIIGFGKSKADQDKVVVLGLCICYDIQDEAKRNRCVHNYTCESDPTFKKIHPNSCPANPVYTE